MNPDSEDMLARLMANMKKTVADLKARYLAARKTTQYTIAAGGGVALLLILGSFSGDPSTIESTITFEARRGDLEVTVLEGGALEALQSQEIRSRIKGREGVKILTIVEEGYQVTPRDVDARLVLVELDKSQLIDQQLNQEIAVETAEATYIERKAQYEIQLNENVTALNDRRQDMRFTRLDFEKFLGGNIVNEIIAQLEIEERIAKAEAADLAALSKPLNSALEGLEAEIEAEPLLDPIDLDSMPPPMRERIEEMMADNGGQLPEGILENMQRFAQGGFPGIGSRDFGGSPQGQGGFGRGRRAGQGQVEDASPTSLEAPQLTLQPLIPEGIDIEVSLLMDDSYMAIRDTLDFTRYANIDQLEDGEAKQQLRNLLDELQVSQEEYFLAQDRIEGQRRLEARGFITPTELEAEELNLSKARNRQAQKETALSLYIQYSFPKDAEQKLSEYENAIMSYQRQLKENIAEQAQDEARFSSAARKFNLERVKLTDIDEQLEFATIRAELPGMVVYGAADQNQARYRGSSSQEAIQEGATVRERQAILTIPDMREMAVKTNIHESAVQRVAVGQAVRVGIDAFPDERLTGVVTKVAVVADSANAFMNPDLKVYPTTIKIEGTYDWLRPGMSAEVEILVDKLEDVIYVPLQAVTYWDDKRVVYVDNFGNPERREVEVGAFSDSFIELTSGLRAGEEVLLLPPQQSLTDISF